MNAPASGIAIPASRARERQSRARCGVRIAPRRPRHTAGRPVTRQCRPRSPRSRAGSPRVSVPVLSNATARTAARRSRCAPPLMRTPLRAAAESADTIDTGVEMTSAQGHEITSSTRDRYSHVATSAPRRGEEHWPPERPARSPPACRSSRNDRRRTAPARVSLAPLRPGG